MRSRGSTNTLRPVRPKSFDKGSRRSFDRSVGMVQNDVEFLEGITAGCGLITSDIGRRRKEGRRSPRCDGSLPTSSDAALALERAVMAPVPEDVEGGGTPTCWSPRNSFEEALASYGVWEDREKIVMLQLSPEIWTI